MAPSGCRVAVGAVLRERHPSVAALPSVVRSILRFAETPTLVRLKHAMLKPDNVAQVEQIIIQQLEDQRLDELEGIRSQTLYGRELRVVFE